MQLPGLRVEIDGCDPDQERDVNACGCGAAGRGFSGDAPDRAGAQQVVDCDEVVGVPHVFGLFWEEGHGS